MKIEQGMAGVRESVRFSRVDHGVGVRYKEVEILRCIYVVPGRYEAQCFSKRPGACGRLREDGRRTPGDVGEKPFLRCSEADKVVAAIGAGTQNDIDFGEEIKGPVQVSGWQGGYVGSDQNGTVAWVDEVCGQGRVHAAAEVAIALWDKVPSGGGERTHC